MDNKNILSNEVAMSILRDTASRLRAIGVHCVVSPMSLPQGMSVSLHVGSTAEACAAADVAAERGGEFADAVDTSKQFAQMVVAAIADAEVEETMCQVIVPHPRLKRDYTGRSVRTLRQLSNGYVTIPAGILARVKSQSSRGSELEFEACACCGLKAIISRITADDIEFFEPSALAA